MRTSAPTTPAMIETLATTVLGPAALLAIGGVLHRSLNKAKAEATSAEAEATTTSAATALLDTQRKNFESLLDPMREELTRLRGRVARLEDRLAEEQSLRRHAIAYIRTLLAVVHAHAPEHQPQIPPALNDYI